MLIESHFYCIESNYTLQSNLQIQPSALMLDDGTSCAGDFKSCSVFIEGFYQIKATACV